MAKTPKLTVVAPASREAPPRALGKHGMALWVRITSEYVVDDSASRELLAQACASLDRAEELSEAIDHDGLMIRGKSGPRENPLIKLEVQCRAFVCRTLSRLGLEGIVANPVGRPSGQRGVM